VKHLKGELCGPRVSVPRDFSPGLHSKVSKSHRRINISLRRVDWWVVVWRGRSVMY
jgi:hypothetical protein